MQPSTARLLVQLNHARHETVLKVFSFCLCIYLNLRRDFLYGYFSTAFIMVVLAEMGDKTQLLAMAFAAKYPWKK